VRSGHTMKGGAGRIYTGPFSHEIVLYGQNKLWGGSISAWYLKD